MRKEIQHSPQHYATRHFVEFKKQAVVHFEALYSYAYSLTNELEEADDLVQDTYLRALRFHDKYEFGTNLKAWLFSILRNSFINKYRKKTKEPYKVDYEDVQNFYETLQQHDSTTYTTQEDVYNNTFSDEISNALNKLPERYRTVVILCDIENYTYEEISEFIECPIGTVRSNLHRARKMLYKELEPSLSQKGYKITKQRA